MDLKTRKQGGGTLTISGDLMIERSADLQKILIEALDKGDHLELDLKEVTRVDVSCLQLLCAANRSFHDIRRDLILKSDKVTDRFRKILCNTGYAGECCRADDFCHHCLWTDII